MIDTPAITTIKTPLEHQILVSLPCAVLILNAKGIIIWANDAAYSLLNLELQGLAWRLVIEQVFSPREDDGHEVSLVDGRRIQVAITSLEELPGQLVVLTDLTATRAFEQARATQNRLMAIGRMMAQLAHQIRTPLSSAMLYTEHLASQSFHDNRLSQWISRIQQSHHCIEQQIEDLLLFARGEMLEPSLVNMQNWSEEILIRANALIEGSNACVNLDNHLNNEYFYLHGEGIAGATLNLIINALQAKADRIHIHLNETNDHGLEIKVEDNGLGMTEEVKAQAFSPFFTTKAQGTGLGLAVVQAVVKAHQGEVAIESISGRGSCITIMLPNRSNG